MHQTPPCLDQSGLWLQAAPGGFQGAQGDGLSLGAWEFHPCPFFILRERDRQLQCLSRKKPQPVTRHPPTSPKLSSSGGRINLGSRHSLKGSPEHLHSSLLSWEFWGCCSKDIYKRNAHRLRCSERQLHSKKWEPRRPCCGSPGMAAGGRGPGGLQPPALLREEGPNLHVCPHLFYLKWIFIFHLPAAEFQF